jgi:hypothetical protein
MSHWQHRSEEGWKDFAFGQPYEKGLRRLREEVLAKTDFDPAVLWQWGTMQAMAIIEILKTCERLFGKEGQQAIYDALHRVGLDVGRQILAPARRPEGMGEAEFMSYFATVINRIAYASLEDPRVDDAGKATFDIVWCPHQDHYGAFDCRVQRYFVQGMLDALKEEREQVGIETDWQVRFDSTIPAGAATCHFTLWKDDGAGKAAWEEYTAFLDAKALRLAGHADDQQGRTRS